MAGFYSGTFVCSDSLEWAAVSGSLTLAGEIACKGNIIISVWKLLVLVDSDGDSEDLEVA